MGYGQNSTPLTLRGARTIFRDVREVQKGHLAAPTLQPLWTRKPEDAQEVVITTLRQFGEDTFEPSLTWLGSLLGDQDEHFDPRVYSRRPLTS